MSGTSDPCLTPLQMRITTRRLDLCLTPMEEGPESITVLVANYVLHQCFMSGTFANAHYHTAAWLISGTYASCLAPVIYV